MLGARAREASSPTISTVGMACTSRGRKSAASVACTTSDSVALQTDGRWVLPFTTIEVAMSRSAPRST